MLRPRRTRTAASQRTAQIGQDLASDPAPPSGPTTESPTRDCTGLRGLDAAS